MDYETKCLIEDTRELAERVGLQGQFYTTRVRGLPMPMPWKSGDKVAIEVGLLSRIIEHFDKIEEEKKP